MVQRGMRDTILDYEGRRRELAEARACLPAGSRLADVMVVWDSYTDTRIPETPLLLRFEELDLLVGCNENGQLMLERGAVSTHRFDLTATNNGITLPKDLNDPDAYCPVWVPDASLAHLAGAAATGASLNDRKTLEVAFENDLLTITATDRDIRCCCL